MGDTNFFQPRLKLKISPQSKISRVTVLLIMPQCAGISLNSAEYAGICQHSECVLRST